MQFGRTNDKEHKLGKTIYMEIINKHYYNMKRDQSISLTYLPPRVRMVFMLDMESQILNPSNDQKNLLKVDPVQELYYKGEGSDTEDYLIKMF